ncbi:MAG: hypothetical protein NTU44_13800 [Bacteroidetes bacterium]|nr:hypothetical protein [Bacteroidota bacterium]
MRIPFLKLIITLFLLVDCAVLMAGNPSSYKTDLIENENIRLYFYEGILHLYQFEFSDAQQDADYLKTRHSASPWGHVLQANIHWWKIITGENEGAAKTGFRKELDLAEKKTTDKSSVEGLYCLIIVNSLRSRYELLNKNYLSTFVLLNRSKDLIRRANGKEEEYEPYYLTQGLFQYFMAAARDKMGLVASLFSFHADRKKGLEYLERLTHSGNRVLKTEGNYFLMKIYLEMENDPAHAKTYADYLTTFFPGNLVFCYYNQKINRLLYKTQNMMMTGNSCNTAGFNNNQLTEKQIKYLGVLLGKNK